MSAPQWWIKPFAGLTHAELYGVLQLRQRVFVVEQACAFLDADGLDPVCHHLFASVDDRIVACARLVPPGTVDAAASIGRVVTAPEVRRQGLGQPLMERAIDATYALYGPVEIYLGAQAYLERFYGRLGFVVSGPGYDEDGIPHLPMRRVAPSP